MNRKIYRIPLFTDRFQKYVYNIDREGGKRYAIFIIEQVTGIKVESIVRLDRVLDSLSEDFKASYADNLFEVNEKYIVNIEIQYKWLNALKLTEKIYDYMNHILIALTDIEKQKDRKYKVIQIVFFNGNVSQDEEFIKHHLFKAKNGNTRIRSKADSYILQFNKLSKLYKEHCFEGMSELERLCYYMKYRYNKKKQKQIKVISKEKQIMYMEEAYRAFRRDPLTFIGITREQKEREEFEEECIEKGMKKGIKQGIKQGIEQGIEQGVEGIVMNMMNMGCSIEEICKFTNLSKERVMKLKSPLK